MAAATPIAIQSWIGQLSGETGLVLLLVSAGLAVLVAVLLAMMLLGRRQQRRELRELVAALEQLRSGDTHPRLHVDSRSSTVLVADAVNRLAQDLSVRWSKSEEAARQLDALLGALSGYAVIECDADWEIRHCSPGASRLVNWDERELIGRSATVLFEAEAWKNLLPKLARRSAREQGVSTRSVVLRHSGAAFNAELIIRTHHGSDGEVAGYVIVLHDVSSQVRLERELEESEARYRNLVEGLREGVLILQEGRVTYANPAMAGLLDLPVDQLIGLPLRDRVATSDVLVLEEALERCARDASEPIELGCTLVGRDGQPLADVLMHVSGVQHEGRPAALVSVFDETLARRARSGLELNEARLDAVLETTSDGVVVFASEHQTQVVTMTNAAFASLFGLEAEQVLGATLDELIALLRSRDGGAQAVAAFLEQRLDAPRTETVTLEGEPPRTVSLRLAPLVGRSGAGLGNVLACRDLTDQRAVEQQLEARADELRRSKRELEGSYQELGVVKEQLRERVDELDRLNRELRKLDELKSELLANVSHELQTPLVSIRGYTEMILKGRLGSITDEQSKGLRLSLKNIDRLIGMIDNLLMFSRMDREMAELELGDFALQAVIDEALALLGERIEQRGIRVSSRLRDPAAMVRGDRDKILQVFVNLIGNAVKFNRDEGRIEIEVGPGEPGFWEIAVSDTGSGIPEQALDKIFDRFYRAAEPAAEQGAGIGLAIVRNVLRLHGCTIRAESRPGEGSTFRFTLPQTEGSRAPGTPGEDRSEPVSWTPDLPAESPSTQSDDVPSPPKRRFRIIRPDGD